MNSVDYENQLLNAIETIVNNAVEKAEYNKTIKAIINDIVDPSIGKYTIKYQDSILEAYSNNIDITYPKGTLVQVLIPKNDMSQVKTIISAVDQDKVEYAVAADSEDSYEIIGNNAADSDDEFGVCSYTQNDIEVLYDKALGTNLINLDTISFDNNIKKANAILCGASFKTSLDSEQSLRGNFGICFELNYKDNLTENLIIKSYYIDVNKMNGNPYNQTNFTRQSCFFDIDNERYDSINKIYIFAKDFPNVTSGKSDDIFIKDIQITCANKLTIEELNSYSLSLISTGKNYFNNTDSNTSSIILLANFKVKGKEVAGATANIEYYWFKENSNISSTSLNYSNYGGEGWECLNKYNTTYNGAERRLWISGNASFTVKKSDITSGSAVYKCVVVYNGINTIEDTIELFNYDTLYNLSIYSDQGTKFYFDNGTPTLTCLINGSVISTSDYTYSWAVVDNNNQYSKMAETTSENNEYNTAVSNYNTLVAAIAAGTALPAANKSTLEEYENTINSYDYITRVENNTIHKIQIKDIKEYATYKCTVKYNNIVIGTAAITLENILKIEGDYTLEIINGEQVFNYNAMGVAPTNTALEKPIEIKPLSFKIYDNLGKEIPSSVYSHCDIRWDIPSTNTMLVGTSVTNVLTYNFNINNIYDSFKSNNNIDLSVSYKGLNLKKSTTFTFVKDGDPGTNGSDIICKIVPNTTDTMTSYPMLVDGVPNYTVAETGKWFKVQLWKNGTLIFNSTSNGNSTEDIAATVEWGILKNKYTSVIEDTSAIAYDKTTNTFSYSGFEWDGANIIKCTVTYDNKYYHSMLPLITISGLLNDCAIDVVPNKGFRSVMYSSAGKEPQYDNTYPFEFKVTRLINGYTEDITNTSNNRYKLEYMWGPRGRVYTSSGWVNTNNLVRENANKVYYKNFRPSDTFNGECVTNAILVQISDSLQQIAMVHIPVYFYLNKNGIAALNNWDGNSIKLADDTGSILAPQVGAGSKDVNNTFTGVLMGKVKEGSLTEKEGLLGYYKGQQTIFLDANSGKAVFGRFGSGQIILDPTQTTKGLIYGGNYVDGTSGMMIDLTTPEIKFGSGNFSVSSLGYLTAKGGGSIAGWSISDTSLNKGKVGISSDNSADSNYAFWAGNTTASSAPFKVTFGGAVTATSATIQGAVNATSGTFGNGTDKITIGTNGTDDANSALYSGSKSTFDSTNNGFYIGTDGIALGAYDSTTGNPFQVTNAGVLTAKSGTIGGWNISAVQLQHTAGNYSFEIRTDRADNEPALLVYDMTNNRYNFYVRADGTLYARNGDFSGTISGSTVTGSTIKANWNSSDNAYRTIIGSDGSFKYFNGTGFLTCGYTTSHPWLSGVNVNQLNGINFHQGTGYGNAGSWTGQIHFSDNASSGNTMWVYSKTNMNIKADTAMKIETGSSYLTLDPSGDLKINSYTGQSVTIYYKNSSGATKYLTFHKGLLVGYNE